MIEKQLTLLDWVGEKKHKLGVKITKSPEENDGILVTESDFHIQFWIDTPMGVCSVGKLVNKNRLYSHEDLWIPDKEYNKHRQLAEAAFNCRRIARNKKEKAIQNQARLPI